MSDGSSEGVTEVNVLLGETDVAVVLKGWVRWEVWTVEGEGEREGEEGRREGGEVDLCEGDRSIFAAERKADGVTSFGETPAANGGTDN